MQSSLLLQKPKVRYGLRISTPFFLSLFLLVVFSLTPASVGAQVFYEGLTTKGDFMNFQISVLDGETGASLTSILVDVYRLETGDFRELVFTRSFYPGEFSLQLDRRHPYLIVLQKKGYEDLKFELSAELVAAKKEWSRILPMERMSRKPEEPTSEKMLNIRKASQPIVPEKIIESQGKDPQRNIPVRKSYFRTSMDVALMAGPRTDSDVLLSLKKGDMVVLEAQLNSSWWKVSFRNYTGWIPADTLRPVQ